MSEKWTPENHAAIAARIVRVVRNPNATSYAEALDLVTQALGLAFDAGGIEEARTALSSPSLGSSEAPQAAAAFPRVAAATPCDVRPS